MNDNEFDYYESGSNRRLLFLLILGIGLILAAVAKAGNGNGEINGNGQSNTSDHNNGNGGDNGNHNGQANGNGGNNANGNGQGPKHRILRLEMVNRDALLTCAGEAGTNYCIEATACLSEPVCWTPICTNAPASSSQFQYLDTCASNYPSRFYRIVTAEESAQHSNNGKHNGQDNNNGKHNGDVNGHPNGKDQGNGNDNN